MTKQLWDQGQGGLQLSKIQLASLKSFQPGAGDTPANRNAVSLGCVVESRWMLSGTLGWLLSLSGTGGGGHGVKCLLCEREGLRFKPLTRTKS